MNFKKTIKPLLLITSVSLLGACASTPAPQQAPASPALPDWVTNPVVENGIADTQCVAAEQGVGMNYYKASATALARAELAKQIGLKVQAMDKTYQRLADTAKGPSTGAVFESVSKQVTDKHLAGSRTIQQNFVMMPDGNHFCMMVVMDPAQTKAIFKDLIEASGSDNLSPDSEDVLYERFLAERARIEMEEALNQ